MEALENVQEAVKSEKKKNGMKKLLITAAACIAVIVLVYLLMPSLFYRVYLGDRVKGIVTVTIDGQPATIAKDTLKECNSSAKCSADGNKLHVSARANEYGPYDFQFEIDEMPDISFHFYSFQFNWWNVTNFDLRYNIDTQKKIVEYRAEHTELKESGRKSDPIIWEGSYPLEEDWTKVCVCSV